MVRKRRLTDYTNVDVMVKGWSEGTFGHVYFGPDARSGGEWVALKTLKAEVLEKYPPVRGLFTKEALLWLSMWPHANLLPARGVTEIDDQVYIVLPYAQCGSLTQQLYQPERAGVLRLKRQVLSLGQRLFWAQMIAAGLDTLHTPDPSMLRDYPIIHRDLKPDNILIQQNGFAQITDLGMAKVAETYLEATEANGMDESRGQRMRSRAWKTPIGMTFAAKPYRAPEQWTGDARVDTYTDMYAFGVILSELVAGRYPFGDKVLRNVDWRSAHLHQTPQPLTAGEGQLPDTLLLAYHKCLAKDPRERPSAREALRLLQIAAAALGHQPYEVPELLPHTPESEGSIWQNLSTVFARFRYFDQALDWNDWALRRDPSSRTALLTRANILGTTGGIDEAIQAYEKAIAATPATDRVALNTVYSNYATALGSAGRFQDAEVAFATAVDALAEAAPTWNNRGANQMEWAIYELENQNRQEALQHVELGISYMRRAKSLNKQDPHYTRALSQFYEVHARVLKAQH